MRDCINLGSAPAMEPCAQVGSENYSRQARIECRVFKDQLLRTFPHIDSEMLSVRSFPHDFGHYFEVVVCYDDNDDISVSHAFEVDNDCPEYWDNEAKEILSKLLK